MSDADVFVSEPVLQVLQLYHGLVDERAWDRTAREQIEILAARLLQGQQNKSPGAAVELHNWLPEAGARSMQDLLELPLSMDDALETVSRAHGFVSWSALVSMEQRRGDALFERTVEDLLRGDITALAVALTKAPDLVTR